MEKRVVIKTEYIKLDQFLKWCGACMTGGEASELIKDGQVCVNGNVELARGKKIRPGDIVSLYGDKYTVAGE
ncbi:MAG: RNA-binding S4 domain-containing protein [Clostridia bacterium]|nr:RNA-binding S4 domain-containing protein [Clostridia bacterium]